MHYHVHVYRVSGEVDFEVEAENDQEARQKALALRKEHISKLGKADCNFIAISFQASEVTSHG